MPFPCFYWWVYIWWYVPYNTQHPGGPQENFCSSLQAQVMHHLGVKGGESMKQWMLTSHSCCGNNFRNVVPVGGCTVVSQRWVLLHPQQSQVAELMPLRYTAMVGWMHRWTAELHEKTTIPDQFMCHAITYLSVLFVHDSSKHNYYKRNVGSACEFSEAQKFFTLFLDDIIKPRLLTAWTGNTQQWWRL